MSDDLENSTGVTNPLVLIDKMIEKGVDADTLGKMMDLSERWKSNQAREAYAAAMNACQLEMPTVIRDKKGDKGAKYAPLETVNFAIKNTYTKHGFSLSFGTLDSKIPDHFSVKCDCRHSGGWNEPYILHDLPTDTTGPKGEPNKTGIQGSVSTLTYGQRKLTCMIFNVTIADEDRDGAMPNPLISDEDIEKINTLIDDCRQLGSPVDYAKFKAYVGEMQKVVIDDLGDVRVSSMPKIVEFLTRKKRTAEQQPKVAK